ncbi:hypothetical protein H0H81_001944 [Sphagnurus paluster]|uniref:Uncharacterized protein n=1 Tax=Sphagnurus paluster TaxID=117069 RepID=A0A9P7KJM3_9AGAR|nr:hypothetical protein H0H81_001944 [Sphagnurus paluster]
MITSPSSSSSNGASKTDELREDCKQNNKFEAHKVLSLTTLTVKKVLTFMEEGVTMSDDEVMLEDIVDTAVSVGKGDLGMGTGESDASDSSDLHAGAAESDTLDGARASDKDNIDNGSISTGVN